MRFIERIRMYKKKKHFYKSCTDSSGILSPSLVARYKGSD